MPRFSLGPVEFWQAVLADAVKRKAVLPRQGDDEAAAARLRDEQAELPKIAKSYHEPRTTGNCPHHGSGNQPLSYPSRLRLHAKAVKQIGKTITIALTIRRRHRAGGTVSVERLPQFSTRPRNESAADSV